MPHGQERSGFRSCKNVENKYDRKYKTANYVQNRYYSAGNGIVTIGNDKNNLSFPIKPLADTHGFWLHETKRHL